MVIQSSHYKYVFYKPQKRWFWFTGQSNLYWQEHSEGSRAFGTTPAAWSLPCSQLAFLWLQGSHLLTASRFREVWASCTGKEEKGKGQAKGLPKVVQEAEQRTAFELFSPEVFQLILSLFYVWFLAHRVFSLFVFFFFLPPLCILF